MTQPKQPEVGPAGRNLIVNVERLRAERGLSHRKLSAELEKAGRVIPPLGVQRMLKAARRTDVDDLLSLAAVLGVTPGALLADPEAPPPPEHAALRAAAELAVRIGRLLAADGDGAPAARRVSLALRRVQVEIEELLEEVSDSPHRASGQ